MIEDLQLRTKLLIQIEGTLAEVAARDPMFHCTLQLKNAKLDEALKLRFRNIGLTVLVEDE